MLPSPTTENFVDCWNGDAVLGSKLLRGRSLEGVSSTNLKHLNGGQPRLTVPLSAPVSFSALRNAVGNIVGIRAIEKVQGIYTHRIVARVQNIIGRPLAKVKEVGNSRGATTLTEECGDTVALPILTSQPRPTGFRTPSAINPVEEAGGIKFDMLRAHVSDLLHRSGAVAPRVFAAPLGIFVPTPILPKTAQSCGK